MFDLIEIQFPNKIPPTILKKLYNHINGYIFLLYVSLVVNLIVFITLCCLLVYTIKV